MISLIKNTIDEQDIQALISWLQTNPRLTKDSLTDQFEQEWAKWLGTKYAVFVNSGSSANLAIIYALKQLHQERFNKVVVPAVSWVTTVSPIIQLGLKPILCEADKKTLAINPSAFEQICKDENPDALMLVHVLGIPAEMDEIRHLCEQYDVLLIEDSCESIGSTYKGEKTGAMSVASSFSFYYGHHLTTIEGGMICTNDNKLYNILKSIRAHGWNRDLDEDRKKKMREYYNIDEFRDLYTFYYPGFNFRATDLQAFLGLQQIKKIDSICERRNEVLKIYDSLVSNSYWKLDINEKECSISNFAYPIITPKINDLVRELKKNKIETRPLVCGSIGRQPFWITEYGEERFYFADKVHDYGLYLPNNHQITNDEVEFVCKVVNKVLG